MRCHRGANKNRGSSQSCAWTGVVMPHNPVDQVQPKSNCECLVKISLQTAYQQDLSVQGVLKVFCFAVECSILKWTSTQFSFFLHHKNMTVFNGIFMGKYVFFKGNCSFADLRYGEEDSITLND